MLKVSVKGSQDGSWGLTQSYLQDANYHGAVDAWLTKHSKEQCFVWFSLRVSPLTLYHACIWQAPLK